MTLLLILALFGLALYVLIPPDGVRLGRAGLRLGLDLQGGSHLVYQADLSGVDDPGDAMLGVVDILQKRIDAFGVTEPTIQRQGADRILIQLPGVEDIDQAKQLIGATARLDFRERVPITISEGQTVQVFLPAEAEGSDGKSQVLTGEYLVPNAARVVADQLGQPEVTLEFNDEGALLFGQITGRNVGKPLGIFLDGNLVSAPTVQAQLTDRSVISGLELQEAKTLAIQLNAGALPVSLEAIFEDTVSATLGADFISRSVLAAIVGTALVMVFMIAYYLLPGLVASLALLVYGALLLALFKLIPVTLTLTAIGGFILSVGMAVDANVLIIERIKEELRGGRTLGAAVETGFGRAWPAIRDSNISTFLICAVLYWFAGSIAESPAVMGFAVTLFLGVAMSMFTAIVVSRAFLRLATRSRFAARPGWFGVKPRDVHQPAAEPGKARA